MDPEYTQKFYLGRYTVRNMVWNYILWLLMHLHNTYLFYHFYDDTVMLHSTGKFSIPILLQSLKIGFLTTRPTLYSVNSEIWARILFFASNVKRYICGVKNCEWCKTYLHLYLEEWLLHFARVSFLRNFTSAKINPHENFWVYSLASLVAFIFR